MGRSWQTGRVNDIPVGTPPAPPGRHAAPSGWYPDPVDLSRERYWDGWQWSREVRDPKGGGSSPRARPTRRKRAVGPSAAPRQPRRAPDESRPDRPTPPTTSRPPAPTRPSPTAPPTREPVIGLTTADGVRLAGFWWRVLAAALDQALLGVVGFLLALPFMGPLFDGLVAFWRESLAAARTGSVAPTAPTYAELLPFGNQLGVALVAAAVQITYHVLMWRLRGATLGQLAMGLRVVPVDEGRSTERLGYGVVVPRAVIWSIPWCLGSLYFIGMINGLWSLWNPRRMAVHDLVARTQVIRTRE